MITENDFSEIMNLIMSAYGDKAFPTDDIEKMDKVLHLWTVMFQDDSPEEVAAAVKDCIATLQFPPRIADIKSRISQVRMAGQPTELEAWAMVYKAIMDSNTYGKAKQAFDRLPKIAQDLVGLPEHLMDWHDVPGDKLASVVESNFLRSYKTKAEREASYHALPADMQQMESWKLPKGVQNIDALPEGAKKSIEDIVNEANEQASAHGMQMTEELARKHSARVDAFLAPMTKEEKQRVEQRENRKAEQFLK